MSYSFKIFTLVFLLFSTKVLFESKAQITPKLTLYGMEQSKWESILFPNTSLRVLYSNSTYDDENVSFNVSCTAPFPIRWNCSSVHPSHENINSSDSSEFIPLPILKKSGTFEAILLVSKSFTIDVLRIACEKAGSPDVKDEIFIVGRTSLGKLFLVEEEHRDSKVIRCITTNPNSEVLLDNYYYGSDGPMEGRFYSEINQSLWYNPLEGFWSNEIFHGQFRCRQNSSSVYTVALNTKPDPYFTYPPRHKVIRTFDENTIKLKCTSATGLLANASILILNGVQGLYTILGTTFLSFSKSDYLSNALTIKYQAYRSNVSTYKLIVVRKNAYMLMYEATATINAFLAGGIAKVNGTAICRTDWNFNNLVWEFEFLRTPELRLENYDKQIQCIGPGLEAKVEVFPCNHGSECSFFIHHCPRGNLLQCIPQTAENNNISIDKGFSQKFNKNCKWLSREQRSKETYGCVSVPYAHLHGIAWCSVEGLRKEWEFFESLDHRKYINWKDVPRQELIRMDDDTPKVLFQNRQYEFLCEALVYLFSDVRFEIEFRNESRLPLEHNDDTISISVADSKLIKNLITALSLRLVLPAEAAGIHCVASLWNSTEVVSASRSFETRQPTEEDYGTKTSVKFHYGQKNCKLVCLINGEPKLKYTWYFNNEEALTVFPELQIRFGLKRESRLEFPEINTSDGDKYSGEYKCEAENQFGKFVKIYILSISEKLNAALSTVYIVLSVLGALLLFVVLIVMALYLRKYKIAKQMLRELTDAELQEFFDGRPELAGNGSNAETVDFLPYNREYEIPFDDLEFSYSDNNLLGSGEFAFVLRGLILSKGKPVALKISKPSTDVDRFKSLLSEVKIMSYIGQHEHVMSLIGVCTEGIRTRSIHIATEICGMGSLNSFLRNSRSNFINLMDVNQDININLKGKGISERKKDQCTTLDLISFSSQIANGMEYLATKSVVHADLATRNVLLTVEKVAKISDFGLSKQLYESSNYVKKSKTPLPWRWMALESLQTLTFSTKSDVWSYGVTLYEIFALGVAPFPNEGWSNEFVARLQGGMRMGRPEYCTQKIYSKIMSCWEKEPEQRPGFSMLRMFFEKLLAKYSYIPVGEAEIENNLTPQTQQTKSHTNTMRYVNDIEISHSVKLPYVNL